MYSIFFLARHISHKAGVAVLLLSLSATVHGATWGISITDNFRSQNLINISSSTALISTGHSSQRGITLAPARGIHTKEEDYSFSGGPPTLHRATINDVALHDVDGDGTLDIIIADDKALTIAYTDLASGDVSFDIAYVATGSYGTLVLGDLDGDGDVDIATREKQAENHYIPLLYRNDGRGGFKSDFASFTARINDLIIADVDDDGNMELVFVARRALAIFEYDDNHDEFNLLFSITGLANYKVVTSGDMDGDGRADIILGGPKLKIYRNTGIPNQRFRDAGSHDGAVNSVALGDVNNDGDLDVVAGANGVPNTLFLNDGLGNLKRGTEIDGTQETTDVHLGDMDGDGDLDLVEGSSAVSSFIYPNIGGAGVYEEAVLGLGLEVVANAVALGDLDNDGDLDAVLGKGTKTLKVCLNQGVSTTAASTTLYDTGHGWVASNKLNAGGAVPTLIYMTTTDVRPANTDITYYLSNNGGGRWYQVRPDGSFRFPQPGDDLRWAARLTSLSPTTSPVIKNIRLEGGLQVYIKDKAYKSGETYNAGDIAARTSSTAMLRLWNRNENELSVGLALQYDNQGFSLPGVGWGAGASYAIAGGGEYETSLVFEPVEHGLHETDLMISDRGGNVAIPDWRVSLTGFGVGAKIMIGNITVPNTRVRHSSTFTVPVGNKGNRKLEITGVETTPSDQFSLADSPWPTMVTIMSPKDYEFVFRPKQRGTATAMLIFSSNAYNKEGNTALLKGRGVAPVLNVFPAGDYSFGEVRSGRSTTRTMEVGNLGDALLKVEHPSVGAGAFSVEKADGRNSDSYSIERGSSTSFVLSFAPLASFRGNTRTELTLISDDPDPARTTYMIALSGEAVSPKLDFELGVCPDVTADGICKFGDAEVGRGKSTTLTITNEGRGEALVISSIKVTDGDFTVLDASSATIEVNNSSTWQVRFSPSRRGPTKIGVMLIINNNDPEKNGQSKVELEGRGIGADLGVSINGVSLEDAGRYFFGEQSVGGSTSARVVVSNNGEVPLEVSGVALASTSSFAWSSSATFTVEPDASTTMHVSFSPSRRGAHETTLTISSNHLGGRPYGVRLAGTGTAPALVLMGFAGCDYATMTRTCDFGEVLAGSTDSATVIVGNVGEEGLRVTPTVVGGVYRLAGPADRLLASGSTGAWTLYFSPDAVVTSYAGALVFESNDPAASSRMVNLDGYGVGPEMVIQYEDCSRIAAGTFWFGGGDYHSCYLDNVRVGTTKTVQVIIANEGNRDLVISSISLSETYSGYYRLDDPASAVITANSSLQWSVSCSAPTELNYRLSTDLDISSNYHGSVAQHSLPCTIVWSKVAVSVDGQSYSSGGAYDFGKVETGTSRTVPVVVTNTGVGRALVVHSLETSGSGFSIVGGDTGATIGADASHTWRLRFSPNDATTHVGTLAVRSDDSEQGEWRLDLGGSGVEAIPDFDPLFFDARVGSAERQTMTIGNIGTAPLRIESLVVTPGAFVPAVSVSDEDVERWLNERRGMAYTVTGDTGEVAPGASTTFSVAFSPRVPSDKDNAVLTVHSNAPDSTVVLTGRGRGPLLLASIGADDNHRYILSEATTHSIGTLVAGDGVAVSTEVTVRLKNIGNEGLRVVADLTTGSGAFRLASTVSREKPIAKENDELTVNFHPTKPGAYTETLTLATSGHDAATRTIHFHGSRRLPLIEVGFGGGCHSTTLAQTCNFGKVDVDTTETATLIVTNNSPVQLLVTPSLAGAGDAYSLISSATQSIAAGSTAAWVVRFTPHAVKKTYTAMLAFTGNHPDATARVNLTGVGAGPGLVVGYNGCTGKSSLLCNLPDVPYGTTATVQVTVTNTGNVNLVVRTLDDPTDGSSPLYVIEGSFPTIITSGRSHTWDVHLRAKPREKSSYSYWKHLRIESNYHDAAREKILRAFIIWPEIKVQINDVAYASGRTYDFGTVWAGTTAATLTIENTGHFQDLVLASIQVAGAGFSLNDTGTATIATTGSITRKLHFSLIPTEKTTSEGTLTIVSNDPDRERYTLTLQGEVPDVRPDFGGAAIAAQTYLAHRRIAALTLPEATSGNGTLGYALTGPGNTATLTLPPGLSFDEGTRTLSGTPTAAFTTATYTWKATDRDGDVAVLTFPITVFDYDSDGDGLIEIGTLEQLNAMRWDLDGDGRNPTNVADYAAAFLGASSGMGCRQGSVVTGVCRGYELTANLDFNTGDPDIRTDDLYYNDGAGWEPVGGVSNGYAAIFDGNGHDISNLYIRRGTLHYIGLFGHLAGSSSVTRVKLLSVSVGGYNQVGGMAGFNRGSISASCAEGVVYGAYYVGVFVGQSDGTISTSCAKGTASGTGAIGVFVGYNRSGGKIYASYATGAVYGGAHAGGLAGENYGEIAASYATGAVNGSRYVGGLVGESDGKITASYATGAVNGRQRAGGLVGTSRYRTVTNGYWDTRTSGQSGSAGGTGKKTFELRAPTTYTGIYAAWNVDVDGVAGGDEPWDFGTSTQYPVLRYGFSSTSVASQKADQPDISTNASLRALRVTSGAAVATLPNLLEDFESGVTSYTVAVDVDAERVTVSATASHAGALVAFSPVDAAPAAAGHQVALTIGGDTASTVSVTAQDGSVTTYVVTVRQPDSLPSFDGATIATQTYLAHRRVAALTLPEATSGNGALGYALTGPGNTATLTLPPGLSFDEGTRTLSGTPTAAFTTATYTWKATDSDGDSATLTFPITVFNYDSDEDGLIEIETLEQLNAMRWDLDGDGRNPTNVAGYAAAFLGASSGMGCRQGSVVTGVCRGYELTANLDFNTGDPGIRTDDLYYNDGAGWEPVGGVSNGYAAIFDGNGHDISNLYIRRGTLHYIGLFGHLAGSSSVTRVKLLSVSVGGYNQVGGVAGFNRGSISASCAEGVVYGAYYVGVFVGQSSGMISTSCAKGTALATGAIGVFVGYNLSGGKIYASYATGAVYGGAHAGGLAGENYGEIVASYATGAVNGSRYVGGLVGESDGKITASYATGAVNGRQRAGGLVGTSRYRTVTNGYWDTRTSGQSGSAGGTGKKTFELRAPTTYTGIYAAWNVDVDGVAGGDDPWDFGTSTQYPVLRYGFSSTSVASQKADQPDISTNASLRALRVTSGVAVATLPNLLGSFESGVTSYTVEVDVDAERVTVSATASHSGASVAFSPADAAPATAGHQVALTIGADTAITVSVTAQDGSVTTYIVTVRQPDSLPSFDGATIATQTYLAHRRIAALTLPEATSGNGTLGYALTGPGNTTTLTLPPGLSFDEGTRTLSGTPTAAFTTATYTWKATDRDGDSATLTFPITMFNYDSDEDGLIEIGTLEQLNAMRWDLDGDGRNPTSATGYAAAFLGASSGISCRRSSTTTDVCKGYELTDDLDFNTGDPGTRTDDLYYNGGKGWEPVGTCGVYRCSASDPGYAATFNGNGYAIHNLLIQRPGENHVGLFGFLIDGSRLERVGLHDVNVVGNQGVGSLVGVAGLWDAGIAIVSSYATGMIKGASGLGGLVGQNYGEIADSYATGTINGTGYSGGLVGQNYGEIAASHATGAVNGTRYLGGLVGGNYGEIASSYATGAVRGIGNVVGGLVGQNYREIVASYATGAVRGGRLYAGGLVGASYGMIAASYATGMVSGGSHVGGLLGYNWGDVDTSYATGAISGLSEIGGLIGRDYGGTITNSYWDTITSGQSGSSFGAGKKTFELRAPTTYTGIYASWNVDVDGVAGGDDPWDFGTSTQYPVLRYGFSSASVALQKAHQPDISTDGRLSALSIRRATTGAGVMTLPNLLGSFESGVTSYTVPVDIDAERVTVSATASHSGASVAFSPADAAPATAGHQVALTIGADTAITASVTAQDGSVTTYVVTVRQPDSLPSFDGATIATQTYRARGRITSLALPTATGGNGTLRYMLIPSLPDGLKLSPRPDTHTYEITGAPTTVSSVRIYTWKATDEDGDSATLTFPITVLFSYDRDQDGLIEIENLAQLNAMRWDLDGDGRPSANVAAYASAFSRVPSGMVCPQSSAGGGVCKGYELVEDLNFDPGDPSTRTDDLYYNNGAGWEPVGSNYSNSYAAIFDGNDYSISNLYVRRYPIAGLFGYLASSSNVARVQLLNVDIEGYSSAGGVAGANKGSISASCVTGEVSGNSSVGGIAGSNHGKITASCATGEVRGIIYVGGIAGSNHGQITAGYATGAVNGSSYVGGIAGLSSGKITASYMAGAVNGGVSVGGIAGLTEGEITASYVMGAVNGSSYVGGLAGVSYNKITASYATGAVNGSLYVGGLIGLNAGYIKHTYSGGTIIRIRLIGVITNSYWDTRTSGQAWSDGGMGKKTFELRAPTAYTGIYATWNVDVDGVAGNDDPWDFGTQTQYPILRYGHSTTSLALQRAVRLMPSTDGRLSALSVRKTTLGGDVALPLSPPFDAGTSSYFATASSGTGRVTVAATAASTRATVTYEPRDADADAATGHQIMLPPGGDAVSTVTVTAQDGSATAYVIVVGRTDVEPSFGTAMIARQIYMAGEAVHETLPKANGGNGALRYALTGAGSAGTPALPPGLSLDAGTRTLSGVPATAYTTATYIWTATDSDGDATTLTFTIAVTGSEDYDSDNNGLIEITTLTQLHAIRWDLDGDGTPDSAADSLSYAPVFPGAATGMGCPTTGTVVGCKGYELMTALNFNTGESNRTDDLYYNAGAGWEPVGGISDRYAAIFDGNGHSISNLYIRRRDRYYLGLFGHLADSSSITRVKLLSVDVEGNQNIGGMAGHNRGSISASCVEGVVRGHSYVGVFAGLNDGTISASCAKGTADATRTIAGGFVGYNRSGGKIYANYATGVVNGAEHRAGGLVGYNYGEIAASYATGAVSGGMYKGGLVGQNYGEIAASYATGAVSRWPRWPSGLVGFPGYGSVVTNSYWDINTSGWGVSYGGIGKKTFELRAPTTYTGIYAAWNVDVDDVAGGDDPWDFGTSTQYPVLRYGFSSTSVASQKAHQPDISTDGRLSALSIRKATTGAGVMTLPNLLGSFDSGVTSYTVGVGADVDRVTVSAAASHSGASVAYSPADAAPAIAGHQVALTIGGDTAITVSVTAQDGSVSTYVVTVGSYRDYDKDEDGLIAVQTLTQLNAIRWDLNGDGMVDSATYATSYATAFPGAPSGMGCPTTGAVIGCKGYELVDDLDFDTGAANTRTDDLYHNGGLGWKPIGAGRAHSYSGVFEGNGHVLSNLFIHRRYYEDGSFRVGLFGYLGAGGKIQSVGLINVDVRGDIWVGGLVGRSEGKIIASYVTGSVSGRHNNVGGLAGNNRDGGVISACYSTASVGVDIWYVGGLVGHQESGGRIIASYAAGTIRTGWRAPGLVGRNYGNISSSYWDTKTSDESSGVQGKTTIELQSPTTYTGIYANWNLNIDGDATTGDASGRDNPWDFGTSAQYPVLRYGGHNVSRQRTPTETAARE